MPGSCRNPFGVIGHPGSTVTADPGAGERFVRHTDTFAGDNASYAFNLFADEFAVEGKVMSRIKGMKFSAVKKLLKTFHVYLEGKGVRRVEPAQPVIRISGVQDPVLMVEQANTSRGMTRRMDHLDSPLTQIENLAVAYR